MAHNHNKIIFLLMIKNESKIIERCISNALDHVDAISILDTGSTDNTVEICEKVLSKCGKPYKISVEPFKNFGHNRSVSFVKAQELCNELKWDPETTYGMAVDADMVIKPSPSFKDFKMTHNGYNVIQANGSIQYYNTRFMKCGHNWKCVGGTHEYWSGDPTGKIPYEVFYIDDKNDGGCKSDKFERDVRLLNADIAENPRNDRAHYYLGQSLKDLGRFKEAIEMFKKRIELGGWVEEVWYSHYQIGKCYEHMKLPHKMEAWMNMAFDFHPRRAEPLYHMTRYFREHSQHYKAQHYYLKGKDIPFPKDDVLFIEDQVYKGLFDYESTIISCYITGKSKQDALYDITSYINRNIPFSLNNVWDNLHYYTEPLTSKTYGGEYSRFLIKDQEQYKVSSCCVTPFSSDPKRKYLMNTRYVNYYIDPNGAYHMRCPDGVVRTKNGYVYLNDAWEPTGDVIMMNEEYPRFGSNIEGLEDVRIFQHQGKMKFMASSKNIVNNGNIVIAYGDYLPDQAKMSNVYVLEGPRPEPCQKNWIYIEDRHLTAEKAKGKLNIVYGWNPMEIGCINDQNTLEVHTTYQTPSIFSRFRGSSRIVEYDGKMYTVIHFVKYSQPRCYYHSVVQFNRDTMRPEAFAAPFSFCEPKIEYCLGFDIKNGMACFIFSRNDCDPSKITMPLSNLRMIPI
jgi:glycosyltransferase involved in cell wall biosynthesis